MPKGTKGLDYGRSARTLRRKAKKYVDGLLAASPRTGAKSIRRLLSNPALIPHLALAGIENPKQVAVDKAIVDNAAEVLQANKTSGGQRLAQQQGNSAAFAAVAGRGFEQGQLAGAARRLHTKPKHIRNGVKRATALIVRGISHSIIGKYRSKSNRNKTPADTINKIINFWTDSSQVVPGDLVFHYKVVFDEAANKHVRRKSKVNKRVLQGSMHDVYKEFLEAHPQNKCSFFVFYRAKPAYIRSHQDLAPNVCTCGICTNLRLFLSQLAKHKDCFVHPDRVPAEFSCYSMARACVCGRVEREPFSTMDCYKGSCKQCGFSPDAFEVVEEHKQQKVCFRKFKYVDKPDGRRLMDLVLEEMTLEAAVVELCSQLSVYVLHDFMVRWQRLQFNTCTVGQLPHELITTADFAENLTFEYDDEVQSMHWVNSQLSLYVVIVYLINKESGTQQVETHGFWSDDLKHDLVFAELCNEKLLAALRSRSDVHDFQCWFRWSDNCSSQFKCSDYFYTLSDAVQRIGIPVQHDYFERNHGKGLHDSEGGAAKAAIKSESFKTDGELLKTAASVTQYCNAELGTPTRASSGQPSRIAARTFHHVTTEELETARSKRPNAATVHGTRSFHCIRGPGTTGVIHSRCMSCTCPACRSQLVAAAPPRDGSMQQAVRPTCENADRVDEFVLHTMTATNNRAAMLRARQEEHSRALVGRIRYGEFIAVVAGDEEFKQYDYYIMEVTKAADKLLKKATDGYGVPFGKGERVVTGAYLAFEDDSNPLVLVKEGALLAMVSDTAVVCRGLRLLHGSDGKYHLTLELHDHIIRCKQGYLDGVEVEEVEEED